MSISVPNPEALSAILRELEQVRGGNGLVRLLLTLADGRWAAVVAGRDVALHAEIAARIERVAGEGSVDLSVQEPKLSLVA
jgi:hypothetical protein